MYPNEPMRRHTMYRIGGPARFYVQVASIGALKRLVQACQATATPWVAVGRGATCSCLTKAFPASSSRSAAISAPAGSTRKRAGSASARGVPLSSVVQEAFRRCLSGLNLPVGTPGTVGGALRMNAGTREQGIASQVVSVTTLSPRTGLVRREASDITWGYRTSSFAPDDVIVECELSVKPADPVPAAR